MPNIADVTIVSHVAECRAALRRQMARAAETIRGMLESNAKVEITEAVYDTPERGYVRTGNLRNSITHDSEDGGHTVVVGTNVKYAPYQELGAPNAHVPAHPYLRPAFENHLSEYQNVLNGELSKI